ncbi:hypothetical protein Agub_g8580 [Astrephomene gubernaculifera]|uniref:EamA domain-containing protein n=1 Tax=Astrephomene gubernaculifera TaxID=47775 RepID=A0AAD3DUL2_9CHLO|nr:hypothetical protein Agub_g8580 [Astrephomene gubernaculifera]
MQVAQLSLGGDVRFSRLYLPERPRDLYRRIRTGAQQTRGLNVKASPDDILNASQAAQAADVLLQHGPQAWNAPTVGPPEGGPHGTHQEIRCTLTGLDGVTCMIEEVPDEEVVETNTSASSSTTPVEPGLLSTLTSAAILISPFFFWGTSMVAMKSVVPHTTPLLLGALRLLPAGVALVGWAAATGRAQPATLKAWSWVLAFALVDAAAFQGFLAEGLTRTSAGLGSVIIDSQPLSVALLAALLFGERLSSVGVAGLLVGVAGLALLEAPEEGLVEAAQQLLSGAWRPELLPPGGLQGFDGAGLLGSGEFWMLLAAQSMAVGTVMVRYVTRHCDPIMATGWHMIIGGAILTALAATHGSAEPATATALSSPLTSLTSQLSHLTLEDALSMSYVSMMGGALSYGVFFWNASHGSLTALSSLTFLTPVFASVAGYLALGEVLSPVQLLGGAVTLSAVWCINHQPHGTQTADASKAEGRAGGQ